MEPKLSDIPKLTIIYWNLTLSDHTTLHYGDGTYHRFLGDRPGRNLYQRIRSYAGRQYGPRQFTVGYPRYILTTIQESAGIFPLGNLHTYGVVESGFVFKPINRETPSTTFVAILIRLGYDGGGLLRLATNKFVGTGSREVGDVHVSCCILPDVPVIERLDKREWAGTAKFQGTHSPLSSLRYQSPNWLTSVLVWAA